jgi:hypothetical protein
MHLLTAPASKCIIRVNQAHSHNVYLWTLLHSTELLVVSQLFFCILRPLHRDILVDLASNKLPTEEYPYIRPPSSSSSLATAAGRSISGSGGSEISSSSSVASSARTRPVPGATSLSWAKRGGSGSSGNLVSSGKRLFVFILGGATRWWWAFGENNLLLVLFPEDH